MEDLCIYLRVSCLFPVEKLRPALYSRLLSAVRGPACIFCDNATNPIPTLCQGYTRAMVQKKKHSLDIGMV